MQVSIHKKRYTQIESIVFLYILVVLSIINKKKKHFDGDNNKLAIGTAYIKWCTFTVIRLLLGKI